MSLVHTRFFLPRPPSCPSSSATMGKVCFIYDKLLITDNDSAIQMTKTPPLACNCKPGWVSSDPKPPTPSLAIARRGGSFSLRQRTTTSHVGSSSSSASVCTHDNQPCMLDLYIKPR